MGIRDRLQQFMHARIDKEKEEGEKFLLANREQEGVEVLPEGIQYLVIRQGSGQKPLPQDTVRAHYRGSLLNGTQFDSSFDRGQPFTAPLRSLIRGWQIVLPMMTEGSTWRLWIPADLAYGDRGAPPDIPGGATLQFEVELIQVVK